MNARISSRAIWIPLIAASLGALTGCSGEKQVAAVEPEAVTGVAVITVQSATAPDWIEAIGTVRAAQSAQIAAQTSGSVTEIGAHEGDRVQSGQSLATIDDTQQRAAVSQAEAMLAAAQREAAAAESDFALAEATQKRYQQLFDKRSVSPQEFDEVKARFQAAEAHRDMARAGEAQAGAVLTQARTSLGYTQVRAPFDGVVTERKIDAGALASPGLPLFTLEDTQHYRLEVTVDEGDIRLVHAGESVPVLLDALGSSTLRGKVALIVPAADSASRSFVVKVEIPPDARVRSGLFGRARFPRGARTALFVPQSSILQRGQLRGVFTIDANRVAQLRYVTLGSASGDRVEVLSGLQGGEKLIAAPGDRDFAGKQIGTQP